MLLRPRESAPATFVMRPIRLPRAQSGGSATNWSRPGRTAGAAGTTGVVDDGAEPDAQPATSHVVRTTRCTINCPGRTVQWCGQMPRAASSASVRQLQVSNSTVTDAPLLRTLRAIGLDRTRKALAPGAPAPRTSGSARDVRVVRRSSAASPTPSRSSFDHPASAVLGSPRPFHRGTPGGRHSRRDQRRVRRTTTSRLARRLMTRRMRGRNSVSEWLVGVALACGNRSAPTRTARFRLLTG